MNNWKQAVETKTDELVSKGWRLEAAQRRARKVCKCLHQAHKAATARRIENADIAIDMTGKFHNI